MTQRPASARARHQAPTIGIALAGNVFGQSTEELAALSEAERSRHRERAAIELRDADIVIVDSIADLPQAIDARRASGERPIAVAPD